MDGFVFSSFMIVLRETLEAALIVAIVLAYLIQIGAREYIKYVGWSVVAAIISSFAVAYVFDRTLGNFEGAAAQAFEGVTGLLAAGILTYMIVWMHRQVVKFKKDMQQKIHAAIHQKEVLALMALPYFAVLREGAETVLFLKAAALQAGGASSSIGALMGFALALLVTTSVFWIGKKISLKPFFKMTGLFLTFVAAGLLAYGIHELEEAGLTPPVISNIWNINHILNDKKGWGVAIFGYNGNPSLVEAVAYWSYLFFMFGLLRRGAEPASKDSRIAAQE